MNKYISKIMLILSFLFLAIIVSIWFQVFFNDLAKFTDIKVIVAFTLILTALSGLFLGLYRIIDLLENK